jgi:hypothetical protein
MRSREPQSVADFCKEQARRITQRRFRWCLRAACAHVRRGRCGTTPGQAGGAGKPIGRAIRRRNARDRYRPRSTTTGVGVEALLHSDEGGLAVLPIQRGRCIAACSARRPFPRRGGRDAPYLEAARFSRRLISPCASLACEADWNYATYIRVECYSRNGRAASVASTGALQFSRRADGPPALTTRTAVRQ